MQVKNVSAYGVTASIYTCDIGEGLLWHQHTVPHGHCVLNGRTKLEIKGEEPVNMTPEDKNRELPPNIDHQITALEGNTIFLNLVFGSFPVPIHAAIAEAKSGGVLLTDGVTIYDN